MDQSKAMKFDSLLAPEEAAAGAASPKDASKPGVLHRPVRVSGRAAKVIGASLALGGAAVGGAFAWSAFKPINPPDVFNDPFKDVLGFALLDKDFNRLPIEERLRLLKELSDKMKSLSGSDSALMAAFAAGITGEARAQLERNIRTLMVDVVDKFALEYARSGEADREKAMEQALLGMFELTGQLRFDEPDPEREGRTPAEQLARVREEATDRADRMKGEGNNQVGAGDVGAVFQWVQQDVNQYSSPSERARTTRFMRDAVRYMRGQDVNTGKAKGKR